MPHTPPLFDLDHRRTPAEIAPGAVHLPGWLDQAGRRKLVAACREWARGPVPMRHTRVRGGVMSVQTVCLGWHWHPYKYTKIAGDVNGARVADLPQWLSDLGRTAVAAAYPADPAAAANYRPDAALINFYDSAAAMGMHQDKDEATDAPVVSLSLGDRCVFRFGNTENRNKPWTDVDLRSGDLFVFGGASRFAFHGVPKVYPGSGDPSIGLETGRLNITLRVTGLDERR
jgi:alkylated DNA repair protein (DNA oxidative demethylase)